MGRRTDASFTLRSRKPADKTRVLLVFEDPASAEALFVAEGPGSGLRVIGDSAPPETALQPRATADAAIGYVVLGPPGVLVRGDEESRLVPIEDFVVPMCWTGRRRDP